MAKKVKTISVEESAQLSEKDIKINALLSSINSKVKGGKLQRASELNASFVLRRPTGITSLDLAIGGGFPAGGFVQLVGEKNSGKTFIANQTCANIQRIYGPDANIALLTKEPFDKGFAKKVGFQVSCSDEEIAEINTACKNIYNRDLDQSELDYLRYQVGNILHAQYSTAEDLFEAMIDIFASGMFQLIVIDSLGSLQTEQEEEKLISEKTYGGIANAITRMSKKLYPLMDGTNKTCIVAINQVRENINAGMFGNPLSIPGGKALAHLSLVTLLFRSSEKLKKKINGVDDVEFGKVIKWRIEKGKCGCHEGAKGEFNYYFGEHGYPFGADTILDLASMAVYYQVIDMAGSWIVLPDGSKVQGKDKFSEMLVNDPQLYTGIRDKVFEKAGLKFLNKEI